LTQRSILKVTVELGELRHVVEGSPETVIEELVRFVSRVIPQYEVAARIMFAPDYAQLLDDLSLSIKVSGKGDILLEQANLPADRGVLFLLAGAHVAKRFGKRESEDATADEVARAVGKASKTIRNTLANLQKSGYVERITRGSYRITTTGLKQVQSNPPEVRREVEASTEVEIAKT